jgi:hypothetical protein
MHVPSLAAEQVGDLPFPCSLGKSYLKSPVSSLFLRLDPKSRLRGRVYP